MNKKYCMQDVVMDLGIIICLVTIILSIIWILCETNVLTVWSFAKDSGELTHLIKTCYMYYRLKDVWLPVLILELSATTFGMWLLSIELEERNQKNK